MRWLERGFHGEMAYMANHGLKRARPAELVPGTLSVITARMDYLPQTTPNDWTTVELDRLQRPDEGIVSVYARGRDYHKVLRNRLQKLSERIALEIGPFGHRAFTDSAPVLEAELAARSGQGWRGVAGQGTGHRMRTAHPRQCGVARRVPDPLPARRHGARRTRERGY